MTIKYNVDLHDQYVEDLWAKKLVETILPALGEDLDAFFGAIKEGDDILTYKRRDPVPDSLQKLIDWSHTNKGSSLFPMVFPVKEYNSDYQVETLYVAARAWYFDNKMDEIEAEKKRIEAEKKAEADLKELVKTVRGSNNQAGGNNVIPHATIDNTGDTMIKNMIEEADNTTKILPFDREHEGTLAKYKGHKL